MSHLQSLQTLFVNQEASVEFGKMSFLLLFFFFFFFRKTLGCTYLPYSNSKLILLPPHILLVFPQLLPTERESTLLSNSLKDMVILRHIFTYSQHLHLFIYSANTFLSTYYIKSIRETKIDNIALSLSSFFMGQRS